MNKEQILKGWVTKIGYYDSEIHLLKSMMYRQDYNEFDLENRKLGSLILNALSALGYENISDEEEDFENVIMQLYASDKQEKLESIKEKVVLDSMGLLEFQENWYGYSTWTIEGYEIETFTLGGHNLLEILEGLEGKFIYLVIDRFKEEEE
ncbi:hypothetical protein UCY_02469 [Enterococcus faecalis EnGen0252]|uniref:hypothetical protein n=1 Tax=Enterococcus faecalis TaxID=1351 RepID=UPI00032D78DD|nr:hypothetical protein [Enterococcus faecalis]EOI20569.1 hypothetical protein UCY_02469 [Enterococcus faecalis EnGen0252]EOL74174.1 hypothetical protein UM5_02549 [Enterococcus faecalis EnGen0280]